MSYYPQYKNLSYCIIVDKVVWIHTVTWASHMFHTNTTNKVEGGAARRKRAHSEKRTSSVMWKWCLMWIKHLCHKHERTKGGNVNRTGARWLGQMLQQQWEQISLIQTLCSLLVLSTIKEDNWNIVCLTAVAGVEGVKMDPRRYNMLWRKYFIQIVICRGGRGTGGRAGCPLITGSVVWSLAPVHMPKHPWTKHWTLSVPTIWNGSCTITGVSHTYISLSCEHPKYKTRG